MSKSLSARLGGLVLATLCVGCDQQPQRGAATPSGDGAHEDLDATLWMQTSAEYYVAAEQTYRNARAKLDAALEDPTWSAAIEPHDIEQHDIEQHDNEPHANGQSLRPGAKRPSAVILDVDETVLDNSPYQARLIESGMGYEPETWHTWVDEARAGAVPGAKEFIDYARQSGVTVFFVTNRVTAVERATRRNLEKLGLIEPGSDDTILSKYERDDWGSNKTSRRKYIAARYRILLLIGDDLNDFVAVGDKPTPEARRRLAVAHRAMWGQRWFLLPNADYGGWERSLFDWDDAAPSAEKLRRKHEHLDSATGDEAGADASQPARKRKPE